MIEKILDILKAGLGVVKDSFTPRSIITYGVYGSVIYLCIKQLPVPELLKDMMLVMQGFWFGEKIAQNLNGGGVK